MELRQIKELMAAMGRTGTKKLLLKKEGFELELEREEELPTSLEEHFDITDELSSREERARRTIAALSRGKELMKSLPPPSQTSPTDVKNEVAEAFYVTSPMVGTFYSAPTPEDPPFVKIGEQIDKNRVVCIIEAMKVMNEVKAGIDGTIAEVLVESGHPVEFGTKLLRIVQGTQE